MVRWYDVTRHNGTWINGMMARWHKGSSVLCDGTMVHGLLGRWLDGTMSHGNSMVRWHDGTMVRCTGKMASGWIVLY